MANWRQLLQKVYANRKQKRLNKIEKVFAFAQKKGSITKKDVQLLMRCGHDSALDYLDALVAQNSLRRVGGFHQKNTRYEVVK
jgi:predicted HTH transcriptional regulator